MAYVLKLILLCLFTIPYGSLMAIAGVLDWSGRTTYCMARGWCRIVLYLSGVRLRVSSEDHLDASQAYVFMANHQSNLDIPTLIAALPRFQLRWIAKKELLRIPFFGWGFWGCHMITINRDSLRDTRSSMKQASHKLANGLSIVVFPEGTRSPDGKLLAFKRGGFVMAQNARAPIVPITIKGSADQLPRGAWRIEPGVVDILIGKVISQQEAASDSRALANQVRQIIGSDLGLNNDELVESGRISG